MLVTNNNSDCKITTLLLFFQIISPKICFFTCLLNSYHTSILSSQLYLYSFLDDVLLPRTCRANGKHQWCWALIKLLYIAMKKCIFILLGWGLHPNGNTNVFHRTFIYQKRFASKRLLKVNLNFDTNLCFLYLSL